MMFYKNNTHKLRTFWILLSMVFFGTAEAQSVKEVLTKIQDNYNKKKEYMLVIDYKLYPTHTSTVQQEGYRAHVYHKRNQVVNTVGGVIQARLGNVYIQLDSNDRKLFYSESDTKAQSITFDIDSIIKYYNPSPIGTAAQSTGKIVMTANPRYPNLELSKIELYYNPKTYTLVKMVNYYAHGMFEDDKGDVEPAPRVEAHFFSHGVLNAKSMAYFSTDYYVKNVKGKLQPSTKFNGYELIDGRIKK